VRPVLKPGLRRLWRDGTTLQFGVDPSRALIVAGVTPTVAASLGSLDGSRTRAGLLADSDPAAVELLTLLDDAGLLDDSAEATEPRGGSRPEDAPAASAERDRLRPDLAALALSTHEPGVARRVLARRRRAGALVVGAGRVGAHVAALLAAAGVGRVVVDDAEVAGVADVCPGGLGLDDVGRPRAAGATAGLTRVGHRPAPAVTAEPFQPDLVVLAPPGPPVPRPEEALALLGRGEPHLLTGVRETTGVVGPLVVPGRTSCLHCQHLTRCARDPDWPLLALQLARRAESGPDACEVTLAALVSALTAAQALAFLDAVATAPGRPTATAALPATAGGTLEVEVPDWRIRRRSWAPQSACPCQAGCAFPTAATP
jgi:hypothetical protein